ncbi:MAG: nucleotidyl transferase AbiEii/AbiGii toxin family protein [bacterium]
MKPLRLRIRDAAQRQGIPQEVIEKDYALSYILAGIYSQPDIKDTLVFKGGTALKKLYFGEYRFSEDLDFSSKGSPSGKRLENSLQEAVEEAKKLFSFQGLFTLRIERYLEREPHPHEQDAFTIRVQFPWHPGPLCRIKLEIAHNEPILLEPPRRRLLHGYDEELKCNICCYPLEEIVAEKLRTLLQTHQKLVSRGWNRPRARDYYDLWRIFNEFYKELDTSLIGKLLELKNAHRGVSFQSIDDFFTDELVSETIRHWDTNLGPFLVDLPEFNMVMKGLKELLPKLLSG